MNLVVLTSSRADYGIYRPLLKKLEADPFFSMQIIAFGTHVSGFHGYTLTQIQEDNFQNIRKVENMVLGDSEEAVSSAMGLTIQKFAGIWAALREDTDLILCLGDRYEMFAAVTAALPYNIPIAHIHGGETSLGAIDNTLRHCLTQMASYHFVSTEAYAKKVSELTGDTQNIWTCGALSLDNLELLDLMSKEEFLEKFKINLNHPSILITFHPETKAGERNREFMEEIFNAFMEIQNYQLVITMPNADPMGNMIRAKFEELKQNHQKVILVENFGTLGYFSIMKHCSFLLGNTSSGILEAASFGKYVINLGERQKGRACGTNVKSIPITKSAILEAVDTLSPGSKYEEENIYWKGGDSNKIVQELKGVFAHA